MSEQRIAALARLREWRLRSRDAAVRHLKGQLEISQRELEKQQRSIEKQLKKKGAPVPEASAMVPPEELAERPKPKVVDTTALPDGGIRRAKKTVAG